MKASISYQHKPNKKIDDEAVEFAKRLHMIEQDRFFQVKSNLRVLVFEATKKTLEMLEE